MTRRIVVHCLWLIPLIIGIVRCFYMRKEVVRVFSEHPMRMIGLIIAGCVLMAVLLFMIVAFSGS